MLCFKFVLCQNFVLTCDIAFCVEPTLDVWISKSGNGLGCRTAKLTLVSRISLLTCQVACATDVSLFALVQAIVAKVSSEMNILFRF